MLELGDHGSTFAGGPVIAAAANAVLDVLTEPGFLGTVSERGDQLAAGLRELGLEPRGLGLMIGFDLPDGPDAGAPAAARPAAGRARDRPGAMRMLPPLTVSEAEVDEAVSRLGAALS